MKLQTKAEKEAWKAAGYRERYAMQYGSKEIKKENGKKYLVYSYSENDPYQDANGAMYDATEGRWVD